MSIDTLIKELEAECDALKAKAQKYYSKCGDLETDLRETKIKLAEAVTRGRVAQEELLAISEELELTRSTTSTSGSSS